MSDVSVVSASLDLQAAPYMAGILAATKATASATQAIADVAKASQAASKVASASGGSWLEVGVSLQMVQKAAKLVSEAIGESIDAANAVDPEGAKVWAKDVKDLQDAFKGVSAEVGTVLRPVIESVMGMATKALVYLGGLDWSRMWKDFSASVKSIRDYLSESLTWMGKGIHDAMVVVANVLTRPWQQLQNVIASSLAFALETAGAIATKIGAVMDAVGAKNGLGDLGGKLTGAGAAARNQNAALRPIGEQMVDGAIDIGKSIAAGISSGASDVLKTAKDFYGQYQTGKGPPKVPPKVPPAADKAVEDAKKANAAAIEAMKAQGAALEVKSAEQAAARLVEGSKQAADEAHKGFEEAAGVLDEAYKSGNLDQIATAQRAAALAVQGQAAAGKAAIEAEQKAADIAIGASAAADEARIDAQIKMNDLQKVADQKHTTEAYKAATEAAKAFEKAQKDAADAAKKEADGKKNVAAETAKIGVQAAEAQKKLSKEAADYARASALGKAALDATQSAVTGSAGSVFGAVRAGLEGADPLKAAIGAGIAIIAKSAGFQSLLGALNTLIDSVGGALGQLFEGLSPLVGMITRDVAPVLGALGTVLETVTSTVGVVLAPLLDGLQPLLEVVGQLLAAFAPLIAVALQLALLVSGLQPILILVGAALKVLAPLIGYLADGIKYVANAIAGAWNWMIGQIQSLFTSLEDLPFIGGLAKGVADGLDSMRVPVIGATEAIGDWSDAVIQATRKMQTDSRDAWAKAQGLQNAANAADVYASQHTGDPVAQSVAAALEKAAAEAYQNIGAVMDNQLVKEAQDALSAYYSTGQGNLTDLTNALAAAYAQQANDAATVSAVNATVASSTTSNTTATKENTKATQALAGSITNMPTGFKLALAQFNAIGSGASGGSPLNPAGAAKLSGNGSVSIGVVHIHIDGSSGDPRALADKIAGALRKLTFERTGGIAPTMPGGRFALSGLS